MSKYYDENGNEVPGVLPTEEAQKLQADLKAREEELQKLREKDLNFKRLRNLADDEKDDLKKRMTEKERLLLSEIEDLRGDRDAEQKRIIDAAEKAALAQFAGDNEDLKASIKAQAAEFSGDMKTAEDVWNRFQKANVIVQGVQPQPNPQQLERPHGS